MSISASRFILIFSLLGLMMACQTSGPKTVPTRDPADGPGTVIHDSPELHDTESLSFKSHPNYVSVEIPFSPVQSIYQQVQTQTGLTLQNRGEAHITVITPPEFSELKSKLTMQDIEMLQGSGSLQKILFTIECVGMVQKAAAQVPLKAFFLVVKSVDLLNFRRRILEKFVSAGGSGHRFDAENFLPHITLGFTQRDLHEADGIHKDTTSCLPEFQIVSP